MLSMDCLSHFFDWDQPIQLQDCFIPDVDTTILETDSFFFQSQPQLQFQQPLFQEEAPLELTELDYFCDQFLPPQETCLPYPKSEIFDETHDLDSFLPAPKLQKLVNSSYHCNPNFFNYYQELDLAPEPSIFPEFRVPDFPLELKTAVTAPRNQRFHLRASQLEREEEELRKRLMSSRNSSQVVRNSTQPRCSRPPLSMSSSCKAKLGFSK
ncbi:unnamed protein product [Brassica rapa subsp. trilocularis]